MTAQTQISAKTDYESLLRKRLGALVEAGRVTREMVDEFLELEEAMGTGKLMGNNFLESYHLSDSRYKRHLEKIVAALGDLGEPHAQEKHTEILEELATMGPSGYLTPWELTLAYLDKAFGDFAEVEAFWDRR